MSEFIEAVGSATPAVAVTGAGLAALKTIVGPTARVFGSTMAEFVEYRMRNWLCIAEAAESILGDDPPNGQVHPRVVHRVLEEATFLDDPVMQQYAGGLLAASRTPDGSDDRAAYYVNLLSSLTANQVRLHHAVYAELSGTARPEASDLGNTREAVRWAVHARLSAAAEVLHNPGQESDEDVVSETVGGLARIGLLGSVAAGPPALLADSMIIVHEPMMVVAPSAPGALLFLWGTGKRTGRADAVGRVPLAVLRDGPRIAGARVAPWSPDLG